MDLTEFKKLLAKHKVNAVFLEKPRMVEKMPEEVKSAFEEIVDNYEVGNIASTVKITPQNKHTEIVRDILARMRRIKLEEE